MQFCTVQAHTLASNCHGHMTQFRVIERSQPDQPIESHQDEPPYGTTIWSHDPQLYKLDHRDCVLTHTLTPN